MFSFAVTKIEFDWIDFVNWFKLKVSYKSKVIRVWIHSCKSEQITWQKKKKKSEQIINLYAKINFKIKNYKF